VKLWATYDAAHADTDVAGEREGLRVAEAASQADPLELILDAPFAGWEEHGHPLDAIRIEPRHEGDPRIHYSNIQSALVIAGAPAELARILGGSLTMLADGPSSKNGMASHVHLDPTSDPQGRYYAPGSSSIVVGFASTT
jgi:hypothetical protein